MSYLIILLMVYTAIYAAIAFVNLDLLFWRCRWGEGHRAVFLAVVILGALLTGAIKAGLDGPFHDAI